MFTVEKKENNKWDEQARYEYAEYAYRTTRRLENAGDYVRIVEDRDGERRVVYETDSPDW